jgi:hypothetical protein
MADPEVLMEGIVFGEQPRWHADRLCSPTGAPPEVIAVDLDGNHEVMLQAPSFPCGDLGSVSKPPAGNELVVVVAATATSTAAASTC